MSREHPYSHALGRMRVVAVYLFVAALAAVSRPTWASVVAGALFVALGEALRTWSAGHLLKTKELVRSGPYRHTRNPLYLGRLLILTGFCLMAALPYRANLLVLLAGYVVFFAYYLPRKERVEPARLRAVHGEDYEAYYRAVPSLWPRLRPYGTNLRSWDRARFLRNREHWMIAGVSLVTLAFAVRAALLVLR